jgi:hypothetical protein
VALIGLVISSLITGSATFIDKKIDQLRQTEDKAYKAHEDSVSGKLIDSLKKSIQLSTGLSDSTVKMIGYLDKNDQKQNLNLRRQTALLDNTQDILHPLYPLRISCTFYIDLKRINQSVRDSLLYYVNYFYSHMREQHPADFRTFPALDGVQYHGIEEATHSFHELSRRTYGVKYQEFDEFFKHYFVPAIELDINKEMHTTDGFVQLDPSKFSFVVFDAFKEFGAKDFVDFGFRLFTDKDRLELSVSTEGNIYRSQGARITSLFECAEGYVHVDIQPLDCGAEPFLQGVDLGCGIDYHDKFHLPFADAESNQGKRPPTWNKPYQIKTKDFLFKK